MVTKLTDDAFTFLPDKAVQIASVANGTISVSKNSEIMDADLIAALQQAFINIGNTDAGKEVIAIYSHNGYQKAQSSDYDNERAAQKLIQELTAAN
jgi:phosphonate transport system substrate-binding protein